MSTININNKVYAMEVDDEAVDLTGVLYTYAGLTDLNPLGFGSVPGQVRGVTNTPAAPYFGKYRTGDRIYARDTGRTWLVLLDNQGTPEQVLVLISEGSAQPAPTGVGPDIVLVVADKVTKYLAFGLSSAVYQTLALAVAALPAGGASILLLDDTYTIPALLQLPNNTRLFSFSRKGVIITSALAAGTLETLGSAEFENVNIDNSVAGPSIRTNGAFTLLGFHGASVLTPIDMATNNDSGAVVIDTSSTIHSVVGGTGFNTVTVRDSVVTLEINVPGVGSTIAAKSSSIAKADAPGVVTIEQGSLGGAGAGTPPSSLTATGTLITGTVTAGQITTNSCVSSAGLVSNVSTVVCRNSTVGSITSATDVTVTDGTCGAITAPAAAAVVSLARSTVSGAVTCAAGTLVANQSTITGSITADVYTGTTTSTAAAISLSASGVFQAGSNALGQITMGAGATSLLVRQSAVHVAAAGAGLGAIHTLGPCPVTLADCYVRADDTLISVSSLGVCTVEVQGYVGGGCRLGDLSNPVAANTAVSDVRAHSVRLETAAVSPSPPGGYTFDGLFPAGGLIDQWNFSGMGASGVLVRIYSARFVPLGFEIVVKNVDVTFGLDIQCAASGSIDGTSNIITLGPNNFLRLRKISDTGWTTC